MLQNEYLYIAIVILRSAAMKNSVIFKILHCVQKDKANLYMLQQALLNLLFINFVCFIHAKS
jgi:hypothetical protein